jgi:hypothetical protein
MMQSLMLARAYPDGGSRGKIIFWTACGLAALWMLGVILIRSSHAQDWQYLVSLGIAGTAVIWGIGRVVLYVLGGE